MSFDNLALASGVETEILRVSLVNSNSVQNDLVDQKVIQGFLVVDEDSVLKLYASKISGGWYLTDTFNLTADTLETIDFLIFGARARLTMTASAAATLNGVAYTRDAN